MPFGPGLVGGHCIGVDPYYLTHKAQATGYHPEIVLAGRRINDSMAFYVAGRLVREMIAHDIAIKGARVLIMGLTFKENCPDLRNTKVIDLVRELESFGAQTDVHDPWASAMEAREVYQLDLQVEPEAQAYDAVVLAVAHTRFTEEGAGYIKRFLRSDGVFLDMKSAFDRSESDLRL